MKKRYHILLRILAILLLLILTAVVAVQIPSVQTKLAQAAIGILEDKIDGNISFDKIKIQPDGLLLTNVAITDKHPYTENIYGRPWDRVDTLAAIGTLRATFTLKNLLAGGSLHLSTVQVDDGMLAMTTEPTADGEMTNNLSRIFRLQPSDKKPGPEEIFSIKKVEVNRFRYILRSFGPQNVIYHGGICWEDMDITTSIKGHELKFADGKMSGTADWCTIKEKRGCVIDTVSGSAVVGRGKAIIDDVRLIQKKDGTNLDLEQLSMTFKDASAFSDFVNSVSMGGTFRPSRLAMKTIYNFSGVFDTSEMLLDITSGQMVGPVSDMLIENFRFKDLNSNVDGVVERCRISGLPDVHKMLLDFNTSKVEFTSAGLSSFVNNLSTSTKKLDLSKIAPGQVVCFSGNGHGTLDDLHVAGDVTSGIGNLVADISLTDILSIKPIGIGGSFEARSLQLGTITGRKDLGSADLDARAQVVLTNGFPVIQLDTLNIHNVGFKGYNYTNIGASGFYDKSGIKASVSARDPNLNLSLRGNNAGKGYQLDGDIRTADLEALGFGKIAGFTSVTGKIHADIPQLSKDAIDGEVIIKDLTLNGEHGKRTIDGLYLSAFKDPDKVKAILDADFMRGDVTGTSLENMEAKLDLHDRNGLIEYFVPGLYVASGTTVNIVRNTGLMNVFLDSPLLGFQNNFLRGVDIDLIHRQGEADIKIRSEKASVGNTDIQNPIIKIGGSYTYQDGNFSLVDADRDSSFIQFSKQHWDIGNFRFAAGKEGVSTEGFRLISGEQSIDIDGGFSSKHKDTLNVTLSKLGFGVLDDVLGQELGLKGALDGNAQIRSGLPGGVALDGALKIDKLRVRDFDAGSFDARAGLDRGKLSFLLDNTSGTLKYISAEGSMDTKAGILDAGVAFDGFNLGVAQPMLRSIFSEMGGTLSGKVLAKGKLANLDVSTDSLRLENAMVRVGLTNVPYTVNGPIGITNQGADFSRLTITDPSGGRGTLSGSFNFNGFKNPALDARMAFRNLQLVNSTEDSMQGFYGTAYASGTVGLRGPVNALVINVDATTSREGDLYIPLGNGATASASKILTFKEREDDIDRIVALRKKSGGQKQSGDIQIHAKVNATPNLGAVVEIDPESGHKISIKGEGNVTLDIRPAKDIFNLGGDYNITDGKYHFAVLQNMAAKDFTIQPGSSIKFNGKPLDSQFDITALYRLKTSLSPLGAETRRNVECGLTMKGKIADPKLAFTIDVPDLDPSTKSTVDGALNTDDKVQKQFLALLLTGNFVPGEESGVFFNTDKMLFSNLSNIMTGQLNNLLSYLNIPLDMGVNYQKNTVGNDIYDVAVSTQLFNNRVLVNGSVGNRQFTSSTGSDFAGDIDIEVKINKSGDFRVKAFSHSQDDYTNFLDNTQRSGFGMSIQREFDKFKDFWKSLFGKKEDRNAQRQRMGRRRTKMKTITVDE